ncbi:hypothetical protein QR685DRAFT_571387 [Neurospora intermedia]|uniref:Uncharacterized protein n=1 Tax=Neurospora intermedia TaxID=5142 RepID=A0ABR3DC41_NEUIN
MLRRSVFFFTWRSVVVASQSDSNHPRVTRDACQAGGRTVPFGGLAIIWIHVLVRQPNTAEHGLLEVFDCGTWNRCNAIRQGILYLMVCKVPVPYQSVNKIKRVHDTYPGLSAIKSTIGIQPLPRHRELQTGVCLRNKLICMRTESSSRGGRTVLDESCDIVSYPSRCSSLVYCGFVDPSNREDAIFQLLTYFLEDKRANRASYAGLVVPATRSYGGTVSGFRCLSCGKMLEDPGPCNDRVVGWALLYLEPVGFVFAILTATARLVDCWAAPLGSGRLAGFNVRFAMLTEQLLVTVGTVNWLQIEAIPLLCSDGLALLNVWSSSPCLHRSPHRCHAETVLVPSSLYV